MRMIASAAVTTPRTAHSNAIATAPEDFTPQISLHKFKNYSEIDQNFLHQQPHKIASKSDPKSPENRFFSPLSLSTVLYCCWKKKKKKTTIQQFSWRQVRAPHTGGVAITAKEEMEWEE
jgi:hypothetical protein